MPKALTPRWMERAADTVEHDIRNRSAGGAWPITREQLANVSNCFCLILGFSPQVPKAGLFRDEVLLVKDRGEELRVMRTAMHELAERLIVAEHFPEIQFQNDANLPHRIADIVADRYARFIQYVFAAHEQEAFRRARQDAERANPPATAYEMDEWAEHITRVPRNGGRKRSRRA